jgi:iron complex outermembrane receptor protein
VDDNSDAAWFDMGGGNWAAKLLEPQTSQDLDVGLNYQSTHSTSEVNYFRSRVRNEIGYDPALGGNVNFDPTQRVGWSLRNRLILTSLWSVRTNLHYVDAVFREGAYQGNLVPNVAKISGNVSIEFALSPKETVTAISRFASGRYMSGDYMNTQPETPGYLVEDIAYMYREKNMSLIATAANLANKNYTDTGIYKSSYYVPYTNTVYPNPGRRFSVVGRYQF